jgi:hypothetical protein
MFHKCLLGGSQVSTQYSRHLCAESRGLVDTWVEGSFCLIPHMLGLNTFRGRGCRDFFQNYFIEGLI